ncbi:MAG: AAA family ATPase [Caldilineaceae bacterium SB0665_bin_25]|nr:AAA family ATPase [Caldilineaceae bacterium SB0665_bin_25]
MKTAIVICGQIGSGKSTVSNCVASRMSNKVVSFGKYIRQMAHLSDRPDSRKSLQDLGDGLYRQIGAVGLLEGALDVAAVNDEDSVVFDGVRHEEVLEEIRRRAGQTIAIYLTVGQEERFRRHRSRSSGDMTLEKFQAIDSHAVETGIVDLANHCDVIVDASQPLPSVLKDLLAEILLGQ